MKTTVRSISITEFEKICVDDEFPNVVISRKDIQDLRDYIDNQNTKNNSLVTPEMQLLRPIRNGVQAINYVGVIQTSSGLSIEILPKIYGKNSRSNDVKRLRNVFLQMLKASRNISSKNAQSTSLGTNKNSLFEIFIFMFLMENASLIKRGLLSDYIAIQNNRKYKKGKLLLKEHLKTNRINQSRFYTEADEFLIDNPANQLIKATLLFLLRQSHDGQNLKLIQQQLLYFEKVSSIRNVSSLFQILRFPRNYQYYQITIDWCRIFLAHQSFSSFSGSTVSIAILFPMDMIYQSFIAQLIVNQENTSEVGLQETRYWLFDRNNTYQKSYSLIPDIVVRHDQSTTILDTKWKLLGYKGPSQADLYQMYAYYTRYKQRGEKIDKVILIYPYSEDYSEQEFYSLVRSELGVEIAAKIQVRFIDLMRDDVKEQVELLV